MTFENKEKEIGVSAAILFFFLIKKFFFHCGQFQSGSNRTSNTHTYTMLNSCPIWLHPSLPMYFEANLRDHIITFINITVCFQKFETLLKHITIITT